MDDLFYVIIGRWSLADIITLKMDSDLMNHLQTIVETLISAASAR
jgi:hypothetical protein